MNAIEMLNKMADAAGVILEIATLDYNERAVLLAIRHQRARAEAAEAEVERLRAALGDCWTLAGLERESAQAKIKRLRAALETAKADGANEERSLHWMRVDAEVQRLREFQRECLLPHEANDIGNDLDEAKAEIERLRNGLLLLQDGMDDETADKVQCLIDNVGYTEDDE